MILVWEPLDGDDPKWDGQYVAVDDYGTIYGLGEDYESAIEDAREHLEFPEGADDLDVFRCSEGLADEVRHYGGDLDWILREEDGVAVEA